MRRLLVGQRHQRTLVGVHYKGDRPAHVLLRTVFCAEQIVYENRGGKPPEYPRNPEGQIVEVPRGAEGLKRAYQSDEMLSIRAALIVSSTDRRSAMSSRASTLLAPSS